MKISKYGLGGLILACACFAGQAYAKEITEKYTIKEMSVDVGDGWQAVFGMKTAFALDTIVGEPKIMCAGTWEFHYAIHGTEGRYDSSNLPQSVIDGITLYDVDIAFDVSSMGTVANPKSFDASGQIGARVACDLGVFYKSGSDKPSFNVASSTSWDETFFFSIDARFDNLSYFGEDKAKDHMRYLKEFGRAGTWEDNGSWVMNAHVNLWSVRHYILQKEREKAAALLKRKNDQLEAERAVARAAAEAKRQAAQERADTAAALIADKGDLSDDVFDDFFADEEDAPKAEAVEIEVAEVNPDLVRWVERLQSQLQAIDNKVGEARTAYYHFSQADTRKHEAMGTYCAPEDGLVRLQNVAGYMGQYAKCIGTRQLRPGPLPKAYILNQSTTITQDMLDSVGYRFRQDKYGSDEWGYNFYSSGMLIRGDVRFFITNRGQVMSMDSLLTKAGVSSYDASRFASDEDHFITAEEMFNGDLVLQLGAIKRSDRYSDQYETKYLLRLDHNLNKVVLLDMGDYYGCGDGTRVSGLREGAKGELIVTCDTYRRYAGRRYVFTRTGEMIDSETAEVFEYNDGIFGDKTELRWDDRWKRYYQDQATDPKRYLTSTRSPYEKSSISMGRGDMTATVDMSTMNFTQMHRDHDEEAKSGSFHIRIEQETEQMVYYSTDNKQGLVGTKIHILSPRY